MTELLDAGAAETVRAPERPPAYRYHLLRAALAAGLPGLPSLGERQVAGITGLADKTFELESLVLGSPEAAEVVIPEERLDTAVAELTGRYPDRPAFQADLAGNGLDEETLRRVLHRELMFDAVMQWVSARRPAVSELDERLFFEMYKERFTQPERRTARHILTTVNDPFPENRRDAARARIDRLAEGLAGRPKRFPSLARKHSECPSAMAEGRLGTLPRGRLYPELDALLFRLPEGAVGGPVETEMGFHLLWCERIHPACTLPFAKARPRIRQLLEERAGRHCQMAWIKALRRARCDTSPSRRDHP
jgi:peptidyl-prolyl cis-trans isomerase C